MFIFEASGDGALEFPSGDRGVMEPILREPGAYPPEYGMYSIWQLP